MRSQVSTRRATVDDIDVLFATVQAGSDSYVEFAPAGWKPPTAPAYRTRSAKRLEHPATWALMAFSDARCVGHVAFFPAHTRQTGRAPAEADTPVKPDGVAYLWQLLVLPAWWGRGVAPLLHDAAITEMRAREYRARVFSRHRCTRGHAGSMSAAAGWPAIASGATSSASTSSNIGSRSVDRGRRRPDRRRAHRSGPPVDIADDEP